MDPLLEYEVCRYRAGPPLRHGGHHSPQENLNCPNGERPASRTSQLGPVATKLLRYGCEVKHQPRSDRRPLGLLRRKDISFGGRCGGISDTNPGRGNGPRSWCRPARRRQKVGEECPTNLALADFRSTLRRNTWPDVNVARQTAKCPVFSGSLPHPSERPAWLSPPHVLLEPCEPARCRMTLDLLTRGRAATLALTRAAAHFGFSAVIPVRSRSPAWPIPGAVSF